MFKKTITVVVLLIMSLSLITAVQAEEAPKLVSQVNSVILDVYKRQARIYSGGYADVQLPISAHPPSPLSLIHILYDLILQLYYICLNFSPYSLFSPFFCQKILSEKFLKVIIKA